MSTTQAPVRVMNLSGTEIRDIGHGENHSAPMIAQLVNPFSDKLGTVATNLDSKDRNLKQMA